MKETYQLKVRSTIGDEADDDNEIVILIRVLKWVNNGLEYRADDKRAKEIQKEFGLNEQSRGLYVPIVKEEEEEEEEDK